MKELKSKTMKRFLARGLRKARKGPQPSDGGMLSLIYITLQNGWHYQVEHVNDSRFYKKPIVAVYAFKPPKDQCVRSADYYLRQEV